LYIILFIDYYCILFTKEEGKEKGKNKRERKKEKGK